MIITNTWVQLTTLKGCLLQKHGASGLTLVYSDVEPVIGTAEAFSVTHNDSFVYPAVPLSNIYVIALSGDVSITSEEMV